MKRRQRHARRKRILTERRENGLFFAHGTFPASAHCCAVCSCGARAFSRDPHGFLEDFDAAHACCDEGSVFDSAPIIEPVPVGDDLGMGIDEADHRVRDLSDSQSEGGESGGSVGEFGLGEPSGVLGLQSVPLSVHEQVDLGDGVVGCGHSDDTTGGCELCALVKSRHDAWIAEHVA